MTEKTLEERVADLEKAVEGLRYTQDQQVEALRSLVIGPSSVRRLPDAIGKPASEPWIPTVEAKP